MKLQTLFCLVFVVCLAAACSESAVEDTEPRVNRMAESQPPSQQNVEPPLEARFEVTAPEPYGVEANNPRFSCQRSFPGSPFRAEWFDSASKIGVLVTGFPLDDGSGGTRVDNFQVTSLAGTHQKSARLSGARLIVRELIKKGASSIFEVSAEGSFIEGGKFTASGHCRA